MNQFKIKQFKKDNTHTYLGLRLNRYWQITFDNNLFVYMIHTSCFTDKGAEKHYTRAIGEEWTGGNVFDDFCWLVIHWTRVGKDKMLGCIGFLPKSLIIL